MEGTLPVVPSTDIEKELQDCHEELEQVKQEMEEKNKEIETLKYNMIV